ncbi:hypothetical protein F4861DRAFT_537189 [Xylaria intraflava]|nr:hypothetical protein F4861DRAFT_537189 [Xylaria intraflava]
MATIRFSTSNVTVSAHPTVEFVDLGFSAGAHLENNQTAHGITGSSLQATVHYRGGSPPPRRLNVSKQVTFPDDANVTITGGAPDASELIAVDGIANRGVWSALGTE